MVPEPLRGACCDGAVPVAVQLDVPLDQQQIEAQARIDTLEARLAAARDELAVAEGTVINVGVAPSNESRRCL